jgi:bifunctional DNA-binding transcriptional regulator/antitoxin component of YhaV-PrlF toxin-antitoxin module
MSRSKKDNSNIIHVTLYVMVGILDRMFSKTRKVGGSLVVTLPKELVEANRIKEGEIIEIKIKKLRKDGFGILKGVGPFTAQDELTTHD